MAAMSRTGGVERRGVKRVWVQEERRQLLTKSRSEATPTSSESACCWLLDSVGYVGGSDTLGDQVPGTLRSNARARESESGLHVFQATHLVSSIK